MRLRQVGHARLGTAQCDLRRCDYFLMLTHACPSVLSRRELTAPCAPWLAAAATSLLKKSESERPATVGAMCVSSSSTSCINIKYESETRVRGGASAPPVVPPARRGRRVLDGRCADDLRAHETGGGTHVGSEATERSDAARCDGGAPEAARGEAARRGRGRRRRRAGTPGRAPTEQTVAGMLTHGHASTVSSSGMTELVLIRAHRRAAHSRLSLSSSTHIARIRRPDAFRPFGTGRSAWHFCFLQRRNRAELLMPRGRQRSRRRPSVAPPLQSLERDGLQASDAVARREAALDLYRLDHLPLRRERLDGFRHLIGDDLAA